MWRAKHLTILEFIAMLSIIRKYKRLWQNTLNAIVQHLKAL